jgi:glutathione S-transferase
MPLIKVHHLNNSRSQRVLWLLEEIGLDYEVIPYQPDAKTMLAPASLRRIHPLGKSNLMSFLARIHARPAYQRALIRGGPYAYAR